MVSSGLYFTELIMRLLIRKYLRPLCEKCCLFGKNEDLFHKYSPPHPLKITDIYITLLLMAAISEKKQNEPVNACNWRKARK